MSEATAALVAERLPEGVSLRGLGEHRLKDFNDPQPIQQLVVDGLPAEFPPLKTLDVPTNLPIELTSFVGRDAELADIAELLDRSRLVTLVGPGGTGKTRLALHAAASRTEHYGNGVFFVDLSPIREPDLLPSSVAKALGIKEEPGRPALETVSAHLRDRRALLVLDNFEQTVRAAPMVADLLQVAPHLQILATSRIRLGLAGEQEYPVPPLGMPALGSSPPELAETDAVRLFAERARAVVPSFEVTDDNAATIAEICARLDGLPLAIELAAAQLRILSPKEVLDRLDRRLPLRSTAGNVPERQRTLRGAIEWSYDLLEASLRAFFARLSVFAGGASFPAIEAVCNPDGDLGLDALDALASLLDQSLIRREDAAGGSRYVMLETIREFAAERLAAEFDLPDAERRHVRFFVELAAEWGPLVRSPRALEATAVLERDYQNIRAALTWCLRTDRADIGLSAAAGLWMFWVEHGPVADGRKTVAAMLELPSAAQRDARRQAALDALGSLAYWEGDYPSAVDVYDQALELSRELEDVRGSVEALKNLSYTAGAAGDPATARTLAEEARVVAREAGLGAIAAEAAGLVGLSLSREGDHEGALVATQEALDGFEAAGDAYWANQMKSRMGSIHLRMGDVERAEAYLRVALAESMTRLPGAIGRGATTSLLAATAAARGQHERALRLTGYSEAVSKRMGGSPPAALLGESAAYVEASRGILGADESARLE
ncbi:MAG TPA: tetratricopeptide repeat protein, partial [Actinomycetota bacterium]|nr:tetratricopeptide repeat protein [Actinomycetota bacterium]